MHNSAFRIYEEDACGERVERVRERCRFDLIELNYLTEFNGPGDMRR